MTKDAYFSMCEELGSEPIESEIPVDFEDLPDEVHLAYHVHSLLPIHYDSMNGAYYGRNLSACPPLMEIMEIDDKVTILKLLIIINEVETTVVNSKKGAKTTNGR